MFASQDRDTLRRTWIDAWRKAQAGELLTPLESQLAALIAAHPEYHAELRGEAALAAPTSPFLHLGLHLAIRDQVATDRPAGIAAAYRALAQRATNEHEAEHRLLEVLGQALWEAQRAGVAPDEQAYLEKVRALIR